MKRLYPKTILFLLFLFIFSLAACNVEDSILNANNKDNQPIDKNQNSSTDGSSHNSNTIHLVTLQYPPYEYEKDGEIKGIAVDIVKEIFDRMGYETKIELLPWARALEMIKNGEADGIFTAYKTPERETFADYSNEILIPQTISLFVLNDSEITFDGDLSKLSNYTFGVVNGVSYGEKFDSLIKENILSTETTSTGEKNIEKLLNKRFDILISNKYGALSILNQKNLSDKIKELTPHVEIVPSYIAFSKSRNLTQLRDEFDKILAKMIEDGTVDEHIEKYVK